jgi:3',5'-cyclic AMP phosphodiesterase CpdA
MIIAQISDTHIALGTADTDRRAADLARTLADINALDPAPDVIIHTGDVVHGGRREDYAAAASLRRAHLSMSRLETEMIGKTCAGRFRVGCAHYPNRLSSIMRSTTFR